MTSTARPFRAMSMLSPDAVKTSHETDSEGRLLHRRHCCCCATMAAPPSVAITTVHPTVRGQPERSRTGSSGEHDEQQRVGNHQVPLVDRPVIVRKNGVPGAGQHRHQNHCSSEQDDVPSPRRHLPARGMPQVQPQFQHWQNAGGDRQDDQIAGHERGKSGPLEGTIAKSPVLHSCPEMRRRSTGVVGIQSARSPASAIRGRPHTPSP